MIHVHVLTTRQLFWVAEIGYLLGIILPKASVLLLYGRIFQTNRWRKIVQLGIIFFLTKTVVFLFPTALQCSPVSAAWIRDRDAKCIRVDVLAYTWSAMTILEDVLLIALPIPTLCKMRLGRLKRLDIVAQLGAGSMSGAPPARPRPPLTRRQDLCRHRASLSVPGCSGGCRLG